MDVERSVVFGVTDAVGGYMTNFSVCSDRAYETRRLQLLEGGSN
jgi:hypothetical protein